MGAETRAGIFGAAAADALAFASVRDLLENRAARYGKRTWLVAPETNTTIAYSGLLAYSRALAALMRRNAVAPGERVAYLMPNGRQAARLLVGLMAAGYVATPLSQIASPAHLAWVLAHAGCAAVFVSAEDASRLQAAINDERIGIRIFVVDPDAVCADGETSAGSWPGPSPAATDVALLMYTSGTTGRPKGVLLSHANVLAGARFASLAHDLGEADRVLSVLPLYHINAQIVVVLSSLVSGGSVVMPRRFSAKGFWSLAADYHCTWLNVVPTVIAYLLQGRDPRADGLDLDAVRFCRSASAPLPPAHQRDFESRFGIGIIETLGLTETAGPILSNPVDPAQRRLGSPGRAFGNVARVADPVTGQELPDGSAGEVQVRGPNVMQGYYGDEEENARVFTADGWLRTGDLGYRDADGFYFITGRLKELIIKGGENIAPREIDEVLLRHPAVLEAAAVGIPDAYYGQQVLAAVVLRTGVRCSEEDLLSHCREALGAFKSPSTIRFLNELPKGPSGKVQRLRVV